MDAPTSLVGMDQIQYMLKLAENTLPGSFVEVGVYQGGAAWHFAELARKRGSKLYLYDTFTGIPYADPEMGDVHVRGDFNDADVEKVRLAIPDAIICQGIFPDTLVDMGDVSFVHCDCDQYKSVEAVCTIMPKMMVYGGIIVFDDYGCLPGATRAVNESFEITECTPHGKAVVRVGITKVK